MTRIDPTASNDATTVPAGGALAVDRERFAQGMTRLIRQSSNIELRAELVERLGRAGYDGELVDALFAWAGTENLEERLEGAEWIDPVVLDELRRQT